jgi:DNA-binding beta-propeller fold protein YncE
MLEFLGYVDLPEHAKPGGFDHAAVHGRRQRLYVAHTANDALDVIDCATQTYVRSIPGLPGVAGALVSEDHDLVFTSNRGEDTIGIVSPERDEILAKVAVGVGPNGLAYDPRRRLLVVANVGLTR